MVPKTENSKAHLCAMNDMMFLATCKGIFTAEIVSGYYVRFPNLIHKSRAADLSSQVGSIKYI